MNVSDAFVWKPSSSSNSERQNSFLLPKSIRGLLIGRSGQGKTTLLNFLLLHPETLDYDNIIVRGRSLHQPEYKVIRAGLEKGLSKDQIRIIFERQKEVEDMGGIDRLLSEYSGLCPFNIKSNFSSDVTDIPDPSLLSTDKKNLLIVDDVMIGPQNNIENYWCRGRHNCVDCFYISQSYFRLPRQTIRENSNIFFIFPQDSKNLIHIYRDLAAIDGIAYSTFQTFCADVWREKYNFVTIDLTKPCDLGKYRKNLNEYWSPKYDRLMRYLSDQDVTSLQDDDVLSHDDFN